MNKSSSAVTAVIIGTAAVWFGSHAGGGFATGNQAMNFFVRFGWHSIWIPLLSMGILWIGFRETLFFARNNGTYDYKSLMTKLYEPYDKILANIFEICYIIMAFLAVGAAIAGAAALLQQILSIPYLLGVIITGIILLILSIFGADLVRNASTLMSITISIAVIILVVIGIKAGSGNISHIISNKTAPLGIGAAIWMGLVYAGFQAFLIAVIVSVAEPLKTDESIKKSMGIGFILNAALLVLVCIMLLGFFPASVSETLPTLFVAQQLGYSWLIYLYSLVLFLALVSTGVTLIYATVARFETVWTKGKGIFENIIVRRIVMSIIFMLLSMSISLFGLTAIVAKGYGMMGYVGIFLVIIPIIFVARYKNHKFSEEKSLEL